MPFLSEYELDDSHIYKGRYALVDKEVKYQKHYEYRGNGAYEQDGSHQLLTISSL